MTCHDYKDFMMGYLDDELDDEQKQAFEKHLAQCSECVGELKEFKKLKQITDQAYDIVVDLENIIRNNIQWGGFQGVLWALPGGFAPQPADGGFYKLGLDILFRIKV